MDWWWILCSGLVVIGPISYQFWYRYRFAPRNQVDTLSIAVRVTNREVVNINEDDPHSSSSRALYFIEFTPVEGGESRSYKVKPKEFEQLKQDIVGHLTLRNNRLVSFYSLD